MSDQPELVVCESVAAIVWHLRELRGAPLNLSGHPKPRPKALCDIDIAWDTRLPFAAVTCSVCLRRAKSQGFIAR